jgi:hypothetical protein
MQLQHLQVSIISLSMCINTFYLLFSLFALDNNAMSLLLLIKIKILSSFTIEHNVGCWFGRLLYHDKKVIFYYNLVKIF